MMGRKVLALVLSIAMVMGSMGMAFAEGGTSFADMPDNWSTAPLNKAVENGLLKGYEEGGKTLIKADNSLTRAEMAAVVNRAFNAINLADISKVTDVSSSSWYAKDMAKAVGMRTFALDTKMRPGDKITRQEAFAVLARAFKLTGSDSDYKALNKFSDKADIAAWALKDLDGLSAAGYIQGSGGKLNPKANITRAEFAVVMDNLVKQYIDEAGPVSAVVASGNVMIRVPGVTLKDVTIKGDLVIGDGVGEGDVTLDNVTVEGRTLVRGGGENSIIIKGNSDLSKIIVSKVDGKVRISVEGNADVEIVYVDDGSDDVVVQGTVGTIEVAGDGVTVTATDATLTSGLVSGDNSTIILGAGTTLNSGTISGDSSAIVVAQGASAGTISVSGSGAAISGQGTVANVTVLAGGDNTSVTTPNTVTTVSSTVIGVTAGGVSVPAGSTATNNSTGTGATVTQPAAGGGGGGGGDTTKRLYVNVNGQDYNIDSLSGKFFTNDDSAGLISIVSGLAPTATTSVESIDITGTGSGVFTALADAADNAAIVTMLNTIATAVDGSNRTARIDDAVATADAITAFSYNKGGVTNAVSKVEITVPALGTNAAFTKTVWEGGNSIPLVDIAAVYDALNGKALTALTGLTMTLTTDQGTKTVVLSYK